MKFKLLFFTSLIVLSLSPTRVRALQCPTAGKSQTDYIQRTSDKRCEGVTARFLISSSPELISFTIGQFKLRREDILRLSIPRLVSQSTLIRDANLTVQAQQRSQVERLLYRLDATIPLPSNSYEYSFKWSSYVIKTEKIDVSKLRAKAFIEKNTQRKIYVPVIFNRSTHLYTFVLSANGDPGDNLIIKSHEILKSDNKERVQTYPESTYRPGEISFSWDGRYQLTKKYAPKGNYLLRIKGKRVRSGLPANMEIFFDHDPKWLE